ncbi:MAG: hypothetical protein J6R99_03980 [Alphaproteobacteria bacterium]|nr:hypothetical protein [Alphaproteobacteria bacterium]
MTSKLKCPFCQTELEQMHDKKMLGCPKCLHIADGAFWAKVIQAKQDLDFFIKEQVRTQTALIERTKELDKCQKDLEIARKALDKADRFFEGIIGLYQSEMMAIIKTALEQIEHKEK